LFREAAATLKREPNPLALSFLRLTWVEARAPFMQAEILRFAGGPIDSGDPPRLRAINGKVNPAFIDGGPTSIIDDAKAYPVIDAALLQSLNGKGGAENVATGFHALELLLWGEGEAERSFTDFLSDSPAGARRADYLLAAAQALVEDLDTLAAAWNPETPGNYRESFLKLPDDAVLTRVLGSAGTLAKSELAGKRLRVPLEARDGALGTDKESGMRVRGTGLISLVEDRDAAQGANLRDTVNKSILAARALKGPFGPAVAAGDEDPKRKALVDCSLTLEALGDAAEAAAMALGAKDVPSSE
jgi:putative iron-regulated protein